MAGMLFALERDYKVRLSGKDERFNNSALNRISNRFSALQGAPIPPSLAPTALEQIRKRPEFRNMVEERVDAWFRTVLASNPNFLEYLAEDLVKMNPSLKNGWDLAGALLLRYLDQHWKKMPGVQEALQYKE